MARREAINESLKERFAEVIGKTITGVRMLTTDELDLFGWDEDFRCPYALEVEGGSILVVSQDEEGNGPGALFLESVEVIAAQLEETRS